MGYGHRRPFYIQLVGILIVSYLAIVYWCISFFLVSLALIHAIKHILPAMRTPQINSEGSAFIKTSPRYYPRRPPSVLSLRLFHLPDLLLHGHHLRQVNWQLRPQHLLLGNLHGCHQLWQPPRAFAGLTYRCSLRSRPNTPGRIHRPGYPLSGRDTGRHRW